MREGPAYFWDAGSPAGKRKPPGAPYCPKSNWSRSKSSAALGPAGVGGRVASLLFYYLICCVQSKAESTIGLHSVLGRRAQRRPQLGDLRGRPAKKIYITLCMLIIGSGPDGRQQPAPLKVPHRRCVISDCAKEVTIGDWRFEFKCPEERSGPLQPGSSTQQEAAHPTKTRLIPRRFRFLCLLLSEPQRRRFVSVATRNWVEFQAATRRRRLLWPQIDYRSSRLRRQCVPDDKRAL